MNPASLSLTYLILWWIIFFIVLPIGIKTEDRPVKGQDSGAPQNPNLWKKALATTLISAALLGIFIYLVHHHILSIDTITG